MSSAAFALLEPRRHSKHSAARSQDGIPVTMCRRCGFRGPHGSPVECIETLRDRIALLEFGKSRTRRQQERMAVGSGGQ